MSRSKEFISEKDLDTFEGWLAYQGFDAATSSPEELAQWRSHFDEIKKQPRRKLGLMKLGALAPG